MGLQSANLKVFQVQWRIRKAVDSHILWSIYGPTTLAQGSKRGFGSHPCRVVSVSYRQIVDCHGRGHWLDSGRPRGGFRHKARLSSN